MQPSDLYDWDKATSLLAAQEPWWEPGTANGYHAITQGYLVGEVVRRITGAASARSSPTRSPRPLGADFHIGTGPEHDERVALVIPPPPLPIGRARPRQRRRPYDDEPADLGGAVVGDRLAAERDPRCWRSRQRPIGRDGPVGARVRRRASTVSACCPRPVAKPCSKRVSYTTDLVLGVPLRFGMGYGLNSPNTPISENPRTVLLGRLGRLAGPRRSRRAAWSSPT